MSKTKKSQGKNHITHISNEICKSIKCKTDV